MIGCGLPERILWYLSLPAWQTLISCKMFQHRPVQAGKGKEWAAYLEQHRKEYDRIHTVTVNNRTAEEAKQAIDKQKQEVRKTQLQTARMTMAARMKNESRFRDSPMMTVTPDERGALHSRQRRVKTRFSGLWMRRKWWRESLERSLALTGL